MSNSPVSKKYLLGIVWLIGNLSVCQAQLTSTVFEDFSQAVINPYLINPSASDSSYKYNIRAQYINETGLIKNVSRFYVDGDVKLKSSQKKAYHFIGVQAINSKLGDYIQRSRLQARYSWYTRLDRESYVSAGFSFGFVNYAFTTTQGGAGGADTGPDGGMGLHYLRRKTIIGFSIQQIFGPVLIPINQSFTLPKLYNFDFSQKTELTAKTMLTVYGAAQHSNQEPILYNLGLMSDISNVLIGVSNTSLRKTSISFGIKQIQIVGAKFMLYYTYSLYHSDFPLPNNTMELFIAMKK